MMKAIYAGDIKPGFVIRLNAAAAPITVSALTPHRPLGSLITVYRDDGSDVILRFGDIVELVRRPWGTGEDEQYWRSLIGSRVCDMNEARRYYPNNTEALHASYRKLCEALEGHELGVLAAAAAE